MYIYIYIYICIHIHTCIHIIHACILTYIHTYSHTGVCPGGHVVEGVATDCYLSLTTIRFRISTGACEKVASDFGLGGGLGRVLRFPPPVATGFSHDLAAIWQKKCQKMKFQIQITHIVIHKPI